MHLTPARELAQLGNFFHDSLLHEGKDGPPEHSPVVPSPVKSSELDFSYRHIFRPKILKVFPCNQIMPR